MATTVFLDTDQSAAGVVGTHPQPATMTLAVAPTTGSETNTIRLRLRTVACWRMDDARFDFNSSFIVPAARKEFGLLRQIVKTNPGCPLSIFGHADPTGDDSYNKQLSGRRARAVYAVVTRRPDLWEEFFINPGFETEWGTRSIQVMLDALGFAPGEIDGQIGPETRASVRDFQASRLGEGIAVDGDPGPSTRAKLFAAYMDLLCRADDSDESLRLSPTDFLGGGADPGGKVDYQGCSEFNPVLVFSTAEARAFQQPGATKQRDAENVPNRRVTAFLFRKGLKLSASKWPCPRWNEGVAGCRTQFFADGDRRRNPQENRRQFEDQGETFACTFYDQLAERSPCEGTGRLVAFRLRLLDAHRDPISLAVCRTIQGSSTARGEADENGCVTVVAREKPSKLRIEWATPDQNQTTEFPFALEVFVAPGDGAQGAFERLHNLGYSFEPTLKERVLAFQQDFGRRQTGDFKDIETELRTWHDGGEKPAVTGAAA